MLSKPHLRQCVIVIDFHTHTAFDIVVDVEVNFGWLQKGRVVLKYSVVVIFADDLADDVACNYDFIKEKAFSTVLTWSITYSLW